MDEIDYTIKKLIKQYGGFLRIITSIDFIIAIICALSFYVYICKVRTDEIDIFIKELANDLLQVSASMFGILFAAFAIILLLSDEKFMKFLCKQNVLNKVLLPFWLISILYVASIIVNLLIRFFPLSVSKYIMSFSVFVFLWAIFGTIFLINDTINFSRRRADFLEYEKEIKEIEEEQN